EPHRSRHLCDCDRSRFERDGTEHEPARTGETEVLDSRISDGDKAVVYAKNLEDQLIDGARLSAEHSSIVARRRPGPNPSASSRRQPNAARFASATLRAM